MNKIEYAHTNYSELLKHFSKQFKTKVKDNLVEIPHEHGEGFIKNISFASELQVLVSDYTLNEDILLQRKKVNEDYFVLRFDDVYLKTTSPKLTTTEKTPKSSVLLMSTKFDWLFMLDRNVNIRTINILLTKDWLDGFLGSEKAGDFIKKYLSLKTSSFNYEPLDAEYKRLMGDIINTIAERPVFENLIVQNRIMLLLERFFTRIYKKMSSASFDVKVSGDDLQRLLMVEQELLKDFTVPPPGIPKLARMAAMSPSKLKTAFREIYGLPLYQYFQKHRMNKAKAMLLSRKYSVKEVGIEVGYSNLSNFAKAFKKSFDQLPSDILNYNTNAL